MSCYFTIYIFPYLTIINSTNRLTHVQGVDKRTSSPDENLEFLINDFIFQYEIFLRNFSLLFVRVACIKSENFIKFC